MSLGYALLRPVLDLDVDKVRTFQMNSTSTSPAQAVNLRGMKVRAAYSAQRMKKPMSWIQRIYPELTEDEKGLLRRFLLGRAPATMPEDLMQKADNALARLKAA